MTSAPADLRTLADLRAHATAAGWFVRRPLRAIGELVAHTSIGVAGAALFLSSPLWILRAIGVVACAIGTLGVATNTHTSSHFATSDRPWINRALVIFGFPFCLNLSATYWHRKHVRAHHMAPNVLGRDHDIDLRPFFRLVRHDDVVAGRWSDRWLRMQWVLLPVALACNAFVVQIESWIDLTKALAVRANRNATHALDVVAMVSHWVVWIGAASLAFPLADVVALYLVRHVLVGFGLFALIAPAHYPAEAVCIAEDAGDVEFVLLQTATTLDFDAGRVGGFVSSGLSYQIEHHLFPTMPHYYYPQASAVVRRFCMQNGYRYRRLPWWLGIWKSLRVFVEPKRIGAMPARMLTGSER